jgi:hypothetical protein
MLLGSRGQEVQKVQEKLKILGYYSGPIDGIFGGHTEYAVKVFQRVSNLKVDGWVGSITWKTLLNAGIPIIEISLKERPLVYKCLELVGSIETSQSIPDCFAGLSGNFDGQGISFGVLQWNLGQETLQPLLKVAYSRHKCLMEDIFQGQLKQLVSILDAPGYKGVEFAGTIQHSIKHFILEPWRGMFKALGRSLEFQQIEVEYAQDIFQKALKMCKDYLLWSERSVALMFDICVQNGSIPISIKPKILADYSLLRDVKDENALEIAKMGIIIDRRLEKVNLRWREDVRERKYTIANGRGFIHNIPYNLELQFGIGMCKGEKLIICE